MAYCNKCGAYIPDGQTKCLACGFDEAEEQKRAAQPSSAAAGREVRRDTGKYYSFSSEEMRRELEERRKKQQEQSRIWAEQESARRAERQRSEAQYRRRDESRLFAALSYISVLFLLPYFLRRGDDYAMYHARQGLVLLIYGVLSDILSAIPVIGWVFGLFRLYCVFKGISNAVTGKREPLPYIGKYGERIG